MSYFDPQNLTFYFALGGAVITWSWNGRLISAGAMKVYTDDRIKVVDDGRELVLNSVTKVENVILILCQSEWC